jgi:hypothetical protein
VHHGACVEIDEGAVTVSRRCASNAKHHDERKRVEIVTSCSSVHRCGLPSESSLVAFVHGRLVTFYTTFTRRPRGAKHRRQFKLLHGRSVNNGVRGVDR